MGGLDVLGGLSPQFDLQVGVELVAGISRCQS